MKDYTAIVARGTDNFNLKFAPGSPLLSVDGGRVSMYSVVGQSAWRKWRAWVPPGTCALQATMFTFANPEPNAKVLLRMGEPPVGGPDSVTPENGAAVDLRNVLAAMVQGAEVPCYAPAGVGSVKLSEGAIDSPPVTTTGQWLYINALEVPGHQIFEIVVRITVDESQYEAWYGSAAWDDQDNPIAGMSKPPNPTPATVTEAYLLERLTELKMVGSLAELCKAKDEDALVEAAKESGLWAALLKFAK